MKTCVTCKHFRKRGSIEHAKCAAPALTRTDPVTGKEIERYAENNRSHYGVLCAPEGRFWEEKQPTIKLKKENHMFTIKSIVAFCLGFLFAMLLGTAVAVLKVFLLFAMVGVPVYFFFKWLNKQTYN